MKLQLLCRVTRKCQKYSMHAIIHATYILAVFCAQLACFPNFTSCSTCSCTMGQVVHGSSKRSAAWTIMQLTPSMLFLTSAVTSYAFSHSERHQLSAIATALLQLGLWAAVDNMWHHLVFDITAHRLQQGPTSFDRMRIMQWPWLVRKWFRTPRNV